MPRDRYHDPTRRIVRKATHSESEKLSAKDLILPLINSGDALTLTSTQIENAWDDEFATVYTTGDHAIDLPASTGSGRLYMYSNYGTGKITVTADGTDKIHGDSSVIFYKGTIGFKDTSAGVWVMQ